MVFTSSSGSINKTPLGVRPDGLKLFGKLQNSTRLQIGFGFVGTSNIAENYFVLFALPYSLARLFPNLSLIA